ncbi:MAG: ABC transporter ATP-binding protein [Halolamina sp.]
MFGRSDPDPFDDAVAEGEPLLRVRNLRKHFGGGYFEAPVRAVDGVSFEIDAGETLGLVGESGCGKTTLGRTVAGLDGATGGSVRSRGTEITDLSGEALRTWQRNAQIVFQDPQEALDDRMTVGEIVREPLDAHDWRTPAERRARVREFLERVGLQEEHYYRYPHQFSGGQRQRVGIARALVLEPDFLVLDEPVSALDVSVQARIVNLLERLQAEFGLTYLFIAHDLSVVRHIADRVAVMYLGNVVEIGPTERVFESPTHPYTASLLSAIPGSVARGADAPGQGRITLRGTLPNPRDPPAGCPFATRCPAKIRPDGVDAPEPVWVAVDEFRGLLREQARGDASVVTTFARRLGLSADDSAAVAREELFGELDVPTAVATELDAAVELASAGRHREAATQLREALGSVCDRTHPEERQTGQRQRSRCLRADPEYEDTEDVLDRRFGDGRRRAPESAE